VELGTWIAISAVIVSVGTFALMWLRDDKKGVDKRLRDLEVKCAKAERDRQSIKDISKIGFENISRDIKRIEDGLRDDANKK